MAQQLAEQAAHAYKAGDFPAAIEKWTQAIQALLSPPSTDIDLKARCLANRAQALLQLRDYEAAERDCGASLRLVCDNPKVLLRRATVSKAEQVFPLCLGADSLCCTGIDLIGC